jgi:prepilin-type N-terminal cleavage/methylation domain-containing protein
MKMLLKGIRHEERGFTLIELLIVVGILAVLAGVVTLGITQFIGRGRSEAANTELHNIQTAVTGLMADAQISVFPCAAGAMQPIGDVSGVQNYVVCTDGTTAYSIQNYIVTDVKGEYNVSTTGRVSQVPDSF